MSFSSLDRILDALKKQPGWEAQQQYFHLLECWQSVVPEKIAQQARPLYISRQVLWVATSSAVWAQNLTMQRYSLLKKLNALLSEPLSDIRFSTAQWHKAKPLSMSPTADTEAYPSALAKALPIGIAPQITASVSESKKAKTPQEAFQRWAAVIQARSHSLPACPQCQSPTPPGELQRWTVCAYCATKQRSRSETQKENSDR
jgi:predicted nucleic acid-binding Zn ribbon protein